MKKINVIFGSAERNRGRIMSLPFEWSELTKMGGDPIGRREVNRLRKVLRDPARNWADARSIIVAGTLSTMGQTLWQCVEAVTMTRWPHGVRTRRRAGHAGPVLRLRPPLSGPGPVVAVTPTRRCAGRLTAHHLASARPPACTRKGGRTWIRTSRMTCSTSGSPDTKTTATSRRLADQQEAVVWP